MLEGSCLCGAVAYEADAESQGIVHCHCRSCRKAHGSAFSSIAAIPRKAFRWTRGRDVLAAYESSPGKLRHFCRTCGSHIVAERLGSDNVMLRLGCLDTPIAADQQWHIWLSDSSTWYDTGAHWPELAEGFVKR